MTICQLWGNESFANYSRFTFNLCNVQMEIGNIINSDVSLTSYTHATI